MADSESVVSRGVPHYKKVFCSGCKFKDCERPIGFVVYLGVERSRRVRDKVLAATGHSSRKKAVLAMVGTILQDDLHRESDIGRLVRKYERLVLMTQMAVVVSLEDLKDNDERFLAWV
jgi:hypothetical protein